MTKNKKEEPTIIPYEFPTRMKCVFCETDMGAIPTGKTSTFQACNDCAPNGNW